MNKDIAAQVSLGLLAALGILFFWPLVLLSVMLAAAAQYSILSVILGIVADLIYGAPPVQFHFLYFPFTLAALAVIGLRLVVSIFVRGQGRGKTF